MDLEELKDLNLTKGQIKVFEALLEHGSSRIQLIQEKTSLERRAIYDILNKLTEKGLVSYSQEKGVKSFQLTHPKFLREAIEKKQETLLSLHNKLPQINELYNFSKPKLSSEVYNGNKAIKALLNEILEYNESFWMGGNSGIELCTKDMHIYFKQWNRRRIVKKHVLHDLVDANTYLEDYAPNNLKKHKKEFYKYCQLPESLASPMVTILFGNKTAQIIWGKQTFAVVTESKEIFESHKKYFDYFWKNPY